MTKVLVVEDDKYLSNAFRLKLSGNGIDVKVASNGKEALKMLDEFTPDLIILDLLMPVMDGFETLKHIRASKKHGKVPVIVATNLAHQEDVNRVMELGANDYINKSEFSTRDLIAKIESHLTKHTKKESSSAKAENPS